MVTEVIEDKDLLDVLQKAIEFENTIGKQKTCFYCGENFKNEKNSDLIKTEEIPDQWTCNKGHKITSMGWEWHDVTGNYILVHKLLRTGLVKIKFKSNKHTEYCLSDRQYASNVVRISLALKSEKQYSNELVIPSDLFSSIIGCKEVKELLCRIVCLSNPLHVLFVGPPSSAKTLFQMEMERLPGAFFLDGANITRAGLTDLLFSYDVRYLVIDEIEEVSQSDMAALISFMETGQLSETKYGRTRTKEMKTWVIGSCNDTSKFSKKLLSRFLCVKFSEYTYEQFFEICKFILQKRGVDLSISEKIARFVWSELESKDVRDVIRIASLVKDETDLDWIRTISTKIFL